MTTETELSNPTFVPLNQSGNYVPSQQGPRQQQHQQQQQQRPRTSSVRAAPSQKANSGYDALTTEDNDLYGDPDSYLYTEPAGEHAGDDDNTQGAEPPVQEQGSYLYTDAYEALDVPKGTPGTAHTPAPVVSAMSNPAYSHISRQSSTVSNSVYSRMDRANSVAVPSGAGHSGVGQGKGQQDYGVSASLSNYDHVQ